MLLTVFPRPRIPAPAPLATAALTGTATAAITEADIVAGGKTIILTLSNDTWVASGATFDAQRQNIINGLTAASSPTNGWNNVVKAGLAVSTVVRTSNTVVTITLSAFASYDISSAETITATIPSTALTGGNVIVASPPFGVSATAGASWTLDDQWKDFSSYPPAKSGWGVFTGNGGTAVKSGSALVITMPAGGPTGIGFCTIEDGSTGGHRYRRMRLECTLSSNFYGNPVNWKLGIMVVNENPPLRFIVALRGDASSPLYLRAAIQNMANSGGATAAVGSWAGDSGAGNCDQSAVEFPRNSTVDVDAWLGGNTSGNADGWLQIYQNGVLVIDLRNLQWTTGATDVDAYQNVVLINGGNSGMPNLPASQTLTVGTSVGCANYFTDSDPR